MKKLVLSVGIVSAFAASAQTVLFSDGFENHANFATSNVGNWVLLDLDQGVTYGIQNTTFAGSGEPMAFIVFNPSATTPALSGAAWTPKSGSKYMASFSAIPDSVTTGNNDWMISPQVQLGASGNVVSFWAKSVSTQWGMERFRVGVSNGGTNENDFTILSPQPYIQVGTEWTYYFFQLPANFNNQNVRVGINCVSIDAFAFFVDDFAISTGVVLETEEFTANKALAFPNPTTDILNISVEGDEVNSVTILSLDGKVISTIEGAVAQVANLAAGIYMYEAKTVSGAVIRNTFAKN
jgi:hypothetical protein